jgi:hypothetical protein
MTSGKTFLLILGGLALMKRPAAAQSTALGQNPQTQQKPRPASAGGRASGGSGAGGGSAVPSGRASGGSSLLGDIVDASSLFGDSSFASLMSDPSDFGNIEPTDEFGVIGGFGSDASTADPTVQADNSFLDQLGSGTLFPDAAGVPQFDPGFGGGDSFDPTAADFQSSFDPTQGDFTSSFDAGSDLTGVDSGFDDPGVF